jgi:hypothetical protein
MKAGTITAKLRDAVQVRFFEDGAERIRFKNIEIPDALKELEIRDFAFDVPTDGSSKITFQLFFDDGILPTEFPPARPRVSRAEKTAMKEAAQETTGQPIPEAERVQLPSADIEDNASEEMPAPIETESIVVHESMAVSYNVTGSERRALVSAISGILDAPTKYLGAPNFIYEVGGYEISHDGTVTGAYNAELIEALEGRGYTAQ